MTKKSSRNRTPRQTFTMINIDFAPAEKVVISDWLKSFSSTFDDAINRIVDGEWKISFSYDAYHECYVGSLTPKNLPKTVPEVPVYLIRHADITRLLGVLIYFWTIQLSNGENLYDLKQDKYDW